MADTPTGETVTPGDSQTTATTTDAPATDNASAAEVERLRKEREQLEMERNQLRNKLAEREKAEEEAKRKQLEDKEEWKTLAEKSQAELQELREAQDREARQLALTAATDNLLQDYPENVKEVAKTTGLSLTDDSEAAKAALKEKLDTIKSKIGTVAPTGANNPGQTTPEKVNREDLVKRSPEGVSPMAMAGAKGDDSVAREYISSLPAIEQMRKQAGLSE